MTARTGGSSRQAGLLRSDGHHTAGLYSWRCRSRSGSCRWCRPQFESKLGAPLTQNSLLFFGIFLIAGIVLAKLMRMVLDETIGHEAGIGDRLAGAVLGAVRVGMVAITLVLIFDQLVPNDRQPGYLTGSQLRPLLSAAGQKGFRSLPPDVTAYIDRLKKDRRNTGSPRVFGSSPLSCRPMLATVPARISKNHRNNGSETVDLGIKGRRAIVCASSKGLGRACAIALAAEGVHVTMTARGGEVLAKTAAEIRKAIPASR